MLMSNRAYAIVAGFRFYEALTKWQHRHSRVLRGSLAVVTVLGIFAAAWSVTNLFLSGVAYAQIILALALAVALFVIDPALLASDFLNPGFLASSFELAITPGIIPGMIGFIAAVIVPFCLLLTLLRTVWLPSGLRSSEVILYLCAVALITFVPFAVFLPLGNTAGGLAYWPDMAFPLAITAIALGWLYVRRARLAELGGGTGRNLRVLAGVGIVMQILFLAYWALLRSTYGDPFYPASVLVAALLVAAWFVLLLAIGRRAKSDWWWFALMCAVQAASVAVTFPGLLPEFTL